MNINDIINGCNYGSAIRADSIDSYNKEESIDKLYYTAGGDDACIDLQTIYNINSDSHTSKGSSYEYTLNPAFVNNNKRRTGDEHFKNEPIIVYKNIYQSAPSYDEYVFDNTFMILGVVVFIFFLIILMAKNSWYEHYYEHDHYYVLR